MKVKSEIHIDADRETVWGVLDDADKLSAWQPALTVTEQRKPTFIAGICESRWSKAIVVYHFETPGDSGTQCVVHANHQFAGFRKLVSVFVRQSILNQTEEDLRKLKLLAETAAGDAG